MILSVKTEDVSWSESVFICNSVKTEVSLTAQCVSSCRYSELKKFDRVSVVLFTTDSVKKFDRVCVKLSTLN